MHKRLLVPTLVLTLAGFLGAGCHDNSGDGTNKPKVPGDASTAADAADAPVQGDATADSADSATDEATDATADGAPDTHADATGN